MSRLTANRVTIYASLGDEREKLSLRLHSREQLKACVRLLRSEGYKSIYPLKPTFI